jgi:hypothetical protein
MRCTTQHERQGWDSNASLEMGPGFALGVRSFEGLWLGTEDTVGTLTDLSTISSGGKQ